MLGNLVFLKMELNRAHRWRYRSHSVSRSSILDERKTREEKRVRKRKRRQRFRYIYKKMSVRK
jgi:hypothetical protein